MLEGEIMESRKSLTVNVLEFEGSAHEFGVLQGKQLKIGPAFEIMKQMQQQVDSDKAIQLLQEISPDFLNELKGLAKGSNFDVETTIQLFSGFNVVMPPMGCSSYAENSYYVRNYDYSDKLYDARFIVYKPISGYASVGFSQQILGRLDGMNEKGLVIGLHFVNEKYAGEGFLATTICRLVLDNCATIDEAVELIKKIPHRFCYNFSILDQDGKTAFIEAAPDEQSVHYTSSLTCTNHFESIMLESRNREMLAGSLSRKRYMQTLSKKKMEPMAAYRIFNDEESPLFSKHYEEFFGTLHTIVYCPGDLKVIIGIGGNCEPYVFSIQDWLEGKGGVPEVMEGSISK